MSERGGNGSQGSSAISTYPDDARSLNEVINPERRRKSGGSCRWQNVIGPSTVIAKRLGAMGTQEYGSSVPDTRQQGFRIGDGQLKVLRADD